MRVPEICFAGSHPLAMKYSFVAAKHSSSPWSSPLLTKGWMLTLHKKEGQAPHLSLSAIPDNTACSLTPMCILSSVAAAVVLLWRVLACLRHSKHTPSPLPTG